mmetsp:Transcript_24463/g.46367  ORF Transcript_24463/g.46367 Transcript_24463/m.46367 type:complete len:573 (+) Transcript_24463:224-1942(+)
MAVPESNGVVDNHNGTGDDFKKGKSSSQKRRDKKKAAKAAGKPKPEPAAAPVRDDPESATEVEVEYVEAPLEIAEEDEDNPIFADFKAIFEKFQLAQEGEVEGEGAGEEDKATKDENATTKDDGDDSDDSEDDKEGDDDDEKKLSKKKKKMQQRMRIAELKMKCPRPEVVEIWDTTAMDPTLLVGLKATRNSVPVPRHWCQKRKFLQGKRGIEKPPWQLPDFIEATGIASMRQAYLDKEGEKKLKQKQRDKMQPKMGKMDIDYQVLHDAFFKFQTKPKMTKVGDVYYEGKEFEQSHSHIKPGKLSTDLRNALGMPENAPPPWLIYMQRYGPPPSYPNLKIPGLNSPIPAGCRFGYEPGEWGKPPVDENGKPIYGDVFGVGTRDVNPYEEKVDKTSRWGDLLEEEEDSDEEEDEEDEDDDDETMSHASLEEEIATGTASISSLPSTATGLETPDTVDLRKRTSDRPLYQVLDTQEASVGGALMGSSHTYVIPGQKKAPAGKIGDVDITLRPEELEGLDEDAIKKKYEQFQEAEKEANQKEDFSDLVAAQANKQKRKAAAKEKEQSKKYKDFKF